MSNKLSKIKVAVFILLLTFYASFLVHKIDMPAADDLPRQIKIGEEVLRGNWDILYENVFSYTEPDYKFYNHHWFSGVIFFIAHYLFDWGGLVIIKTLIMLLAFGLLFRTALRKADFWLVVFISIPALLILRERTGLRPEIFSYLFISLYFYLLMYFESKPESRKIYWLIPLQLLWVNMHVFFSIGIMLVGGLLFEKVILNWKDLKNSLIVKKLLIVFISVVVVSFINPRGFEGVFYRYPDITLEISENRSISEYQKHSAPYEDISITLFKPSVYFTLISIFLYGFYLYKNRKDKNREKIQIFYLLAVLATATLGFFILRSIAMFALVFLFTVPAFLNSYFVRFKEELILIFSKYKSSFNFLSSAFVFSAISILIYLSFSGYFAGYDRGIGLASMSMGGINFYNENNLKGPIFNDADIGSYLIYNLYPKEKVFSDNRFGDAYSPEFWDEVYIPAFENDEYWKELDTKNNFNVIFFYQYDNGNGFRQFMYNRMKDPEWAFVYGDAFSIIFVRNSEQNKEVIEKNLITPENAYSKLSYLLESPHEKDVIAAADIFNLLDRLDLSRNVFLDVVTKRPSNGKIWMIMGEWELSINRPENSLLALMYLSKAIDVGHKTPEAYSFLGLAYHRLERNEEALRVLNKALKINPIRSDALDLRKFILNEPKN